jgi:hypothetical protein
MGGGASRYIKAPTIELLPLDGFRMSVGRTSATTWAIEGAGDVESSA